MGVGPREMGYLFGQYRRLAGHFQLKRLLKISDVLIFGKRRKQRGVLLVQGLSRVGSLVFFTQTYRKILPRFEVLISSPTFSGLLIGGKGILVASIGRLFGVSMIATIGVGLLLAPGGEFSFVAFGEVVNQVCFSCLRYISCMHILMSLEEPNGKDSLRGQKQRLLTQKMPRVTRSRKEVEPEKPAEIENPVEPEEQVDLDGDNLDVRMMKGKDSRENTGYAFVTFRTKDLGAKAIEDLNNTEFQFVVHDKAPSLGDPEHKVARIDWNFNSWGGGDNGCYGDWSLDFLVSCRKEGWQ
ncbi:hypothetical protein IFM89_032707 [Coptis chinensis]|uniref:RRM domain-containing protein n=1 Tax=Coptis chinensis TaxID=261450 RepID=A0A835II43_9MAGN|nr:hypothetical protein IFM89_032707 [Coptis chinensis]